MHGGDGGSIKYWGSYAKRVADRIGDYSLRFVDGASGGVRNTLSAAGNGASAGLLSGGYMGAFAGVTLNVSENSPVRPKL